MPVNKGVCVYTFRDVKQNQFNSIDEIVGNLMVKKIIAYYYDYY